MNYNNPYKNKDINSWLSITEELINKHPLKNYIVDICLKSWQSIINTKINTYINLKMKDMNVSPQSIGNLLHDVIPEYIKLNIKDFRKGYKGNKEKDIVCEYDDFYSFEVKTSSNEKDIFGNRSYALSEKGKNKSGYYLTINFDKLDVENPVIKIIKFGWLDYTDWKAQKSEKGQQASLKPEAKQYKLITLYTDDNAKL